MSQFFGDIHLRHPCIEENEFRALGERILATGMVQTGDVFILALNYAIFACCDVLLEASARSPGGKPNGWHWYQISDDLVDKKILLTGSPGDLALIQLLLFQVSLSLLTLHVHGVNCRRPCTLRLPTSPAQPTRRLVLPVGWSSNMACINNDRFHTSTQSSYTPMFVCFGMSLSLIVASPCPVDDRTPSARKTSVLSFRWASSIRSVATSVHISTMIIRLIIH